MFGPQWTRQTRASGAAPAAGRHAGPQVGVRDARPVGCRREVRRIVGRGDHGDGLLARPQLAGCACLLHVRARADAVDAGCSQVLQRVEQR
jgi:hypothetical protein